MGNFTNKTLRGRTALITGAGGLLGPHHGIGLTNAGAKVIAFDIQFDSKDHQSHKLIDDMNYYDADLEFSNAIAFAKKNGTKFI